MHILLTRPLDDSIDLILKFGSQNHKVSHLPLLSIKKKNTMSLITNRIRGLFLQALML